MKTFEITLKHNGGLCSFRVHGKDYATAKANLLRAEKAPEGAVQTWRVVPTAKQITKTKSLMRGL